MNIYIPEPVVILVGVLAFGLGFLYRKYHDYEEISDSYQEGFEKGASSVVKAISQMTGQHFELEFNYDKEPEE